MSTNKTLGTAGLGELIDILKNELANDSTTIEMQRLFITKGALIKLNVDGTERLFRVIKVDGDKAEVVCMSSIGKTEFDENGTSNVYVGSTLDAYLSNWFTNDWTSAAKNIISPKTFTQDSWSYDSSGDYAGVYYATNPYYLSLGSETYGTEITRNVYALSAQDIIDYLGVTTEMTTSDTALNWRNIMKTFYNTQWDSDGFHYGDIWLRSAGAGSPYTAFCVYGGDGRVDYDVVGGGSAARPAFTIDLSTDLSQAGYQPA